MGLTRDLGAYQWPQYKALGSKDLQQLPNYYSMGHIFREDLQVLQNIKQQGLWFHHKTFVQGKSCTCVKDMGHIPKASFKFGCVSLTY